MNRTEWEACNAPELMYRRVSPYCSERKRRLYAAAYCREALCLFGALRPEVEGWIDRLEVAPEGASAEDPTPPWAIPEPSYRVIKDEYIRAWAIQLLAEDRKPSAGALEKFLALAKADASPVVRLYLASAMQRTPIDQRKAVLEALLGHDEDAGDQNLPQMYWYALEPAVGADKRFGAAMLGKTKIAKVRELIARRMAAK